MKNKKYVFLLLIFSIILFAWFRELSSHIGKSGNLFDYWNVVWTCIGAFAVPVAIATYWFGRKQAIQDNEDYQKKEEEKKIEEDRLRLIQKDIPSFWSSYEQYLFSKKNDIKNYEKLHLQAIGEGITLLIVFQNIKDKKALKEADSLKIYMNLVASKMSQERRYFSTDFDIESTIDDILQVEDGETSDDVLKLEEQKLIDSTEILIVRIINSTNNPDDYRGDWRININRARKIKYVIGVQGFVNMPKKFVGIIKVDNVQQVEDRVKFIGSELSQESPEFKDISENIGRIIQNKSVSDMNQLIPKLLTNWRGINPTVYLNHLEVQYKENQN